MKIFMVNIQKEGGKSIKLDVRIVALEKEIGHCGSGFLVLWF